MGNTHREEQGLDIDSPAMNCLAAEQVCLLNYSGDPNFEWSTSILLLNGVGFRMVD